MEKADIFPVLDLEKIMVSRTGFFFLILEPDFSNRISLQFLEIWLEKSGLRKLGQEIWFEKSGWPEKQVGLFYKSTFFLAQEKWLTRKKNPSLQNHFSRTAFLHFSRNVVAEIKLENLKK